jgi:thymidylate kinase
MVKQEPRRWVVVNSDQKWDEVQAELKKVIITGLTKS